MSSTRRNCCFHCLRTILKQVIPEGVPPLTTQATLYQPVPSPVKQSPELFLCQGCGIILRGEHSGKKQTCNDVPFLWQIPTEAALEQMVCSILSRTSEDEAVLEGHPADCPPRWSEATDYLVHAVNWLQASKQVPSAETRSVCLHPSLSSPSLRL